MEQKTSPLDERLVVPGSERPLSRFSSHINYRLLGFALFTVALGIAFRHLLIDLVRLSMRDQTYSYMPLIPLVSGYLFFTGRQRLFLDVRSAFLPGGLLAGFGVFLYLAGISWAETTVYRDQLSQTTLAFLIIWYGGFISSFGVRSSRSASFPLLFLLFIVPIPSFALSEIVQFLQQASTEVASAIFQATGVPVLRVGFQFELPGLSVVVAEQCCGIQSSLSLFITGVLAAYFGLNSPWRRGLLMLSVLPITIFKNALRIITLTLLGAYVDERILGSVLHRAGGIPFFGLALLLFGVMLWFLRRSDVKSKE